jgi:hypothetical protein
MMPRSSRQRMTSRRTGSLPRMDKISEDVMKTIMDKCDEAIKWLDANQLAEVEEFNDKQ